MAELRTTSDDRWYTGGIVVAVWLAGLAGLAAVSPWFPLGQRAATAPAPAPAPTLSPTETLPPIVVVAERADAYAPDCRPAERGAAERHCTPPALRDDPFAAPPEAPASSGRRGPLP
jgi:hypothetical protein